MSKHLASVLVSELTSFTSRLSPRTNQLDETVRPSPDKARGAFAASVHAIPRHEASGGCRRLLGLPPSAWWKTTVCLHTQGRRGVPRRPRRRRHGQRMRMRRRGRIVSSYRSNFIRCIGCKETRILVPWSTTTRLFQTSARLDPPAASTAAPARTHPFDSALIQHNWRNAATLTRDWPWS